MRTIRIHVDLPLVVGAEASLGASATEHVLRVLRLTAGDPLMLFNGDGCNYPSTIRTTGKQSVRVHVDGMLRADNESPLQLTLAQGIARGEKMDWIVQKATELGAVRIVPLLTERSEVRLDEARARKRLLRWQALAISACEQSGRARLPVIDAALTLEAWLSQLPATVGLRMALLPEAEQSARALHFTIPAGVLVAGPEGGLGERDLAALRGAGFAGLRLGPRILRTETAGLAALAALQAIHGDG